MPVLEKTHKNEFVELAARKALIAAETDVLVAGGGPAGIGAALGAAHAGCRVVLVERYGFLGGNATAGLVMPLMSFHNQHAAREGGPGTNHLFPADHGPGEPVISGVVEDFVSELVHDRGGRPPSAETGYAAPFDPEVFKWTALRMLDRAGVQMLFHSFASSVLSSSGEIQGVVFETKSGPIVVKSKITVDCTGDGDIAYLSGAPHDMGRPQDGLTQPMTLMFRMGEFDATRFEDYVKRHPDQWKGVHGLWDLIRQATAKGLLQLPREDILLFGTPREREIAVNSSRMTGVSGVDIWDLSRAEYIGRHQVRQIVHFLNEYVPGFADSYAIQSGVQAGVRETRRIRGRYTLTEEDVLGARKFPDVIARSSYPIDIHNPEGKGTVLKRLPLGEAYDIPLRCLTPLGVERLLVAGRCISGTHEALSSYRVMPVCMATGQAAGVCAALAARGNSLVKEIRVDDVQTELLRQKANLGLG